MVIRVLTYNLPDGVKWYRRIISRSTQGNLILRFFKYNIWFIKEDRYGKKSRNAANAAKLKAEKAHNRIFVRH